MYLLEKSDIKRIKEILKSTKQTYDIEDVEAGRIAWRMFRAKWKKAITMCTPDEKTFLHAFVQGCKWMEHKRRKIDDAT